MHDGGTGPPTAHGSPLPPTAEEKEEEPLPNSRFNTLNRRSKLAKSMSSLGDSAQIEWFDAEDDLGEEFFLDEPTPEEDKERSVPHSEISSLHPSESSDDDEFSPRPAYDIDPSLNARQVVRRTGLPSGPVGDEGSLFAILKNNVGKVTCLAQDIADSWLMDVSKDLTTIALPVSFNEPLTMLQRTAEELEYYDLLHQAAEAKDPTQRLCFIAAFAVSGYAHTKYRTGRKGL